MGLHDSGYKLLFSHPHLVESLIRGFVPGSWIDGLDFSSLEPVSEAHPRDEIAVRYDDMIWRLRWRGSDDWIYVYLLLESGRSKSSTRSCQIPMTTSFVERLPCG